MRDPRVSVCVVAGLQGFLRVGKAIGPDRFVRRLLVLYVGNDFCIRSNLPQAGFHQFCSSRCNVVMAAAKRFVDVKSEELPEEPPSKKATVQRGRSFADKADSSPGQGLVKTSPTKSEGGGTTAYAKRSRDSWGSRSNADSGSSSKRARSADDLGDGGDDGEEEELYLPSSRACKGCLRVGCLDFSYTVGRIEGVRVKGKHSRLLWCALCQNVHNACFGKTFTLAMLERHLKLNSENRLKFFKLIVAYVSLKVEHAKHVTSPVVEKRVEVLEWVFAFCGVPFPMMQVCLDIKTLPGGALPPGSHLCRLLDSPERVAALVPVPAPAQPSFEGARMVPPGYPADRWPFFPPVARTPELRESFATWTGVTLQQASLVKAEPEDGGDKAEGTSDGEASLSPAEQKLRKRIEQQGQALELVIVALCQQTIDATKPIYERDFTPLQGKIAKLRADVVATPFSHRASDVDTLQTICLAGKNLVRPMCNYRKFQRREFLGKCLADIELLETWLRARGHCMGVLLSVMYAKGTFLRAYAGGGAVKASESFITFIEKWLGEEDFKEQADMIAREASQILTECVPAVLCGDMQQPLQEGADDSQTEALWQERKVDLAASIKSLSTLCANSKALFERKASFNVDAVEKVLQAFSTVVDGALQLPTSTGAALTDAFTVLETLPEASLIAEGLKAKGTGEGIKSDADVMLVVGEYDQQCDEEFSLVADSTPAQRGVNGEEGWALDADMITVDSSACCMAADIILDALVTLKSLLPRWSARGRDQALPRILNVLTNWCGCIMTFNARRNEECVRACKPFLDVCEVELQRTKLHPSASGPAEIFDAEALGPGPCFDAVDETCIEKVGQSMGPVLQWLERHYPGKEAAEQVIMATRSTLRQWELDRQTRLRLFSVNTKTYAVLTGLTFDSDSENKIFGDIFWDYAIKDQGIISNLAQLSAMLRDDFAAGGAMAESIWVKEGDSEGVNPQTAACAACASEFKKYDDCEVRAFYKKALQLTVAKQLETMLWDPMWAAALQEFMRSVEVLLSPSLLAPRAGWVKSANTSASLASHVLGGAEKANAMGKRAMAIVKQEPVRPRSSSAGEEDFGEHLVERYMAHLPSKQAALGLLSLAEVKFDVVEDLAAPPVTKGTGRLTENTFDAVVKAYSFVDGVVRLLAGLSLPADDGTLAIVDEVKRTLESGQEVDNLEVSQTLLAVLDQLPKHIAEQWPRHCACLEARTDMGNVAVSLGDVILIVKNIEEVWLPLVRTDLHKVLMSRIEKISTAVHKATPPTSHIVSASRYNASIAKRQLLSHPSRTMLPPLIHKLDSILKSYATARCSFGVAASKADEEKFEKMIQEADASLENAQDALLICAVVNVVEEVGGGAEGQRRARGLLAPSKGKVTGPLRDKLEKMAKADAV